MKRRIVDLVDNYDLLGLIEFSQQVPETNQDQWRKEVMESGFLALYSYLTYDHFCGKLGKDGFDILDDILDAAEIFCGSPLHKMRAEVLSFYSEKVKDTDHNQAKTFAIRAINELNLQLPFNTEDINFRAYLYHELAILDGNQVLHYWQLAIKDLKESSHFNLWILYYNWEQSIDGITEAQKLAYIEMNFIINQQLVINPDLIWELIREGIAVLENNWILQLETQISAWLQTALSWECDNAQPALASEAGSLLHKLGKTYKRSDCYAKAIKCFKCFTKKKSLHAMQVYYIANVLEDWAQLDDETGRNGTDYLYEAWDVYDKYEPIVQTNFSALLHYAEFLERLYFNEKIERRPKIEKIQALAKEAELMGRGYYEGPVMIQVHLAIANNDADTAIYHLCRSFLNWELCTKRVIKNLYASLTDKTPAAVVDFLNHTLIFFDEVDDDDYYYNPVITWAEINELSSSEILTVWQQRMLDIRNRSPRFLNSLKKKLPIKGFIIL